MEYIIVLASVALLMIQVLNLFTLSLVRHACEDIFKERQFSAQYLDWYFVGMNGCYKHQSLPKLF